MASNTQNCHVPENKKKSCGWIWLSEEFKVNIGLRQGNDPLLFIMVVALIQQEVQQEGCSQEGDVCKRSGHDSRQKTRTTGSVGGMEGVFKKKDR